MDCQPQLHRPFSILNANLHTIYYNIYRKGQDRPLTGAKVSYFIFIHKIINRAEVKKLELNKNVDGDMGFRWLLKICCK